MLIYKINANLINKLLNKKNTKHDLQNAYSAINVPIKDYLLYVP